jgi:hypothetical protein
MLATKQRNVPKADITQGEFNNGEHLFVQLERGKNQTVSCRLPNGAFVTFAFVPGDGEEFECVDIHSTVGKRFYYKPTDEKSDVHYRQHAIGFSRNGDTFDTRKANKPTGLLTLLLNKTHHQ